MSVTAETSLFWRGVFVTLFRVHTTEQSLKQQSLQRARMHRRRRWWCFHSRSFLLDGRRETGFSRRVQFVCPSDMSSTIVPLNTQDTSTIVLSERFVLRWRRYSFRRDAKKHHGHTFLFPVHTGHCVTEGVAQRRPSRHCRLEDEEEEEDSISSEMND